MAKHLRVNLQYASLISRIFCAKIQRKNFSISSRSLCSHTRDDDKNVVRSPLGEISVPEKLFHEVLIEYSNVWDKRVAVKCARSGKKYTFRQLRNLSKALAAGFQNKLKLSKGDVIAVILRNCPEYPLIFLAASQIGAIITTVNPLYTSFEIQGQLSVIRAKLIVTSAEFYEKCAATAKELRISDPIVIVRMTRDDQVPSGTVDFSELLDESGSSSLRPVDVKPQDTLVVPFSSGTSGVPKGVVLTHRNVVSNLVQLSHPDTTIFFAPTMFRQTSILGILPMCHIFGLVVMTFFTIKEGARLVILPSFEPREFVKTMYRYKVAVIYAVPPLITFLTHEAIKGWYMRKVQYIVNGAARYSPKDAAVILGKAENVKIVQGYGMTEASPVLAHTYSKRMQKLNTIGVPIASTKLKVVSLETGEALPARKEGELYAFGPQIMKGYYERPEETRKAIDPNGWLKTGDVAYYDEDGDFYIVDRVKELIKVSGFQVSPAEVEETLKIHPKIKDAVVIGVPDPKTGEVPKAFIIPHKKDDLTAEEVTKFISEKLSSYKQLKGGVVFVDELPKSAAGKVLRNKLKEKS